MTDDTVSFLRPRHGEAVKALWHGALGVLALGAGVYNASAWLLRREPHLARNSAVYAGVVALEVAQVRRHLRSCR